MKRTGTLETKNVLGHYESGYESVRLETDVGKLEAERTRELLRRFLPPAPAKIFDVGGGPGIYAFWLAGLGYEVHLIDIVPLHIELAEKSRAQKAVPLASARVGDARSLPFQDCEADAVLLMGPLYHLTERADRLAALEEARRVLKNGGILLAAAISRFASALDGIRCGFLKDPRFVRIVDQDLENGKHQNPTDKPEYFMDAFFHHPDELRAELQEAGFEVQGIIGIEGPGWLVHDFDSWWKEDKLKDRLLHIARELETEPSLSGISAHLMGVGRAKR